jgi:hypothetical protein
MSYQEETEADTRANRIDPVLVAAGWGKVEGTRVRREVICPGRIQSGGRRGKGLSCDYVLEYRGHKLGALEAKRAGLSHREGVAQSKDYAQRLGSRFAFASNGFQWFQCDMVTGSEDDDLKLPFPTPDELWERCFPTTTSGATASARCPSRRRRQVGAALLPAQRHQRRAGGHRQGATAHPADAGHRHGQDLHRLPDRLEAVPRPLEPVREPSAARASCSSPTATSSPIRPTTPSPPSPDAVTRIDPDRSARRGACRRTPASSSRSSRPS